jgi:hypothetical protein
MSLGQETRFRIRTLLITLTLATVPCYCAGFFLVERANWGASQPTPTVTIPATRTPLSLSELQSTPAPPPMGGPLLDLDLAFDWQPQPWDGQQSEKP